MCNCEGNTYNIGMGCCVPVLAPIENYYTKYEIDKMLSGETSGCCITPEEVDEKIDDAVSGITIPTKASELENDVPYLTEHQDLSNYALKSEIPSLDGYATTGYVNSQISSLTSDFVSDGELSSYTYDKATIDSKIASGGTFDPTLYYNKTETDDLLDEKLDASAYTPTDLSNYYNKTEIDNKLTTKADSSTLNNYMLKTQIWCGTQSEYDAITTKDSETIYLIHE